MGIVNVTPDSFFDGGKFRNPNAAFAEVLRLSSEGADLIDLGAESTRPGAQEISAQEELGRLLPVLEKLKGKIGIPISVDTTKSAVARAVLESGVSIINDVSGLTQDAAIADVVAEFNAGLILMHRRGTPETMQSLANYEHLMEEIVQELSEGAALAKSRGVRDDQIVHDPGIGFSKNAAQNFEIINRLSQLKVLGRPVLLGPSRKSFIGSVTGETPENRLAGTIAACALGVERGANILRVHDIKEVKSAILVTNSIIKHNGKDFLS